MIILDKSFKKVLLAVGVVEGRRGVLPRILLLSPRVLINRTPPAFLGTSLRSSNPRARDRSEAQSDYYHYTNTVTNLIFMYPDSMVIFHYLHPPGFGLGTLSLTDVVSIIQALLQVKVKQCPETGP